MCAAYAELHCWSNFSFLEGAAHPEELAERGAALGLRGLALTDRDGLYGMVRFTKAASAAKLPAICGAELTLEHDESLLQSAPGPAPGSRARSRAPNLKAARAMRDVPTNSPRLVLLVRDAGGYANLAHLLSIAQMRGRKRDARLRLADLEGKTAGLVALSGWRNGLPERALLRGDEAARDRDRRAVARPLSAALLSGSAAPSAARGRDARAVGGAARARARRAVRRHQRRRVRGARGRAPVRRAGVREVQAHRCRTRGHAAASQRGVPSQDARRRWRGSSRRIRKAIANTLAIAERCAFRLDKLAGQFPFFPLPAEESSPQSYLRTLVYAGAAQALSACRFRPKSSGSSNTNSASSRGWIWPATS